MDVVKMCVIPFMVSVLIKGIVGQIFDPTFHFKMPIFLENFLNDTNQCKTLIVCNKANVCNTSTCDVSQSTDE